MKARIIKNGNVNLNNIILETGIPEIDNLVSIAKKPIDPIEFSMAFYLWSKDNVHPIPTGNGYRLKPEEFKVKHDLKSVVKFFEENIYGKN